MAIEVSLKTEGCVADFTPEPPGGIPVVGFTHPEVVVVHSHPHILHPNGGKLVWAGHGQARGY